MFQNVKVPLNWINSVKNQKERITLEPASHTLIPPGPIFP